MLTLHESPEEKKVLQKLPCEFTVTTHISLTHQRTLIATTASAGQSSAEPREHRHWKTKASQTTSLKDEGFTSCPVRLHKNRHWKTKACTIKHSYDPVTSQEFMRPECLQPTYHLIDAVQLLGAKIIMIINGKAILMRIRMLLLECHYLATQWGYERKLSNATTTLKLTLTCWISTSCPNGLIN